MQSHPNNNTQTNPKDQDPDILAAIAAAEASMEPSTTVRKVVRRPAKPIHERVPEVVEAPTPEPENDQEAASVVQHEHRGELDSEEYDAMLNAAFREREQRQAKRAKIRKACTAAVFLITCGGAGGWYAYSPENRAEVHGLWNKTAGIAQDVKDGTDINKIMETYDEAAEKIAVRQDQINDASVSLGMDPTVKDEKSQQHLINDMKKVTGDARTTLDRDAEMQERFGKFAKEKRAEMEAKKKKEIE